MYQNLTMILRWLFFIASLVWFIRWVDRKYWNRKIAFNIFYVAFIVYTTLVTFLGFPVHAFYRPRDCLHVRRVARIVDVTFSPFLGITWDVRGRNTLRFPGPCVVVLNHQSTFDIMAMFVCYRDIQRMIPVSKVELFYNPFFGPSAYLGGVVFIDRGNSPQSIQRIERAARRMKAENFKLCIFPEGTRNKTGGILSFKKGAFHIAVQCQVPIMPVVVSPYYFIHREKRFFDKGRVILEALPMISTSGLTSSDVGDVTERVRSIMDEKYQQLGEELRASLPPDYPGLP